METPRVQGTAVVWPQLYDKKEINFGFVPKLSIPQPLSLHCSRERQDDSPNPPALSTPYKNKGSLLLTALSLAVAQLSSRLPDMACSGPQAEGEAPLLGFSQRKQ